MSELAQSPEVVTAEPPPATAMPLQSTMLEWPADGSPPVSLSTGQDDYASEAPAEEPPVVEEEPETTPPSDAPIEAPPVDLAALTANLTAEQIRELTKNSPALKRALDGEIGSRLQRERAAIVEQAKLEAVAEYFDEKKRLETALAQMEEIDDWQFSDPERYAAEVQYSPEVQQWKANLVAWRQRFEARGEPPPPAKAQPAVDRNAVWVDWSNSAADEARGLARESVDYWDQMPAANRKALENLAFSEGGNWMKDAFVNFKEGTQAVFDKRMKEAVEAAREAGRNEALAERNLDSPVMVNSSTKNTLSPVEIHIEHAANGLRNITREQLAWANAQRGIN